MIEINYSPFPYQEQLHLDNHRFQVIAGGRRVGKSVSLLHELIVHCLTRRNALAWWVAPTYRDAKEIGWDNFMEYYPQLKPAIKKINHSNLTVTFINDSKMLFKGSDNENSLRGRGLTAVVLDEAAFIKEDVWTKAIRPALSDKKGWAKFSSTPNGRNWYFYLFRNAGYTSDDVEYSNGRKSWAQFHWPTSLNPIIDDEELEDAKANLSSLDYRQEYEAEFVTKAGMVYDDFNEENIVSYVEHRPHTHTYFMGMDFGFVNPSAITLMAVDNSTEWVYQLDEVYVNRTAIEQINDLIVDMCTRNGIAQGHVRYIFTDPAGNADELSSGISPVDYLRGKGWRVDNKGSEVAPGLALVRSYVMNAKGERRFFVHEKCKETIRSMYGYCYKLGVFNRPTEEPDKDNLHDHACDAVRYFFTNRFDNAKYIFSDLYQHSYTSLDSRSKKRIMQRCGDCRRKYPTKKPYPPYLCNDCMEKAKQEIVNNAY